MPYRLPAYPSVVVVLLLAGRAGMAAAHRHHHAGEDVGDPLADYRGNRDSLVGCLRRAPI
jgi:hypothetical protein